MIMTTENSSLSHLQSQIERLRRLVAEPVSPKTRQVQSTRRELPPLREELSCKGALSVGTLRREMKQRQLQQQRKKLPPRRIVVKPEFETDLPETSIEEIKVKYADIILNIPKKQAAIDRANAALRQDRSVLLVADPEDDDLAASRLALRTVHAACHPGLVDTLPGTIKRRDTDGVLTLEVHRRSRAY